MPQCVGCSKPFPYMDDTRCEPCTERAEASPTPIPRSQWKSCKSCGKRFEYLLEDRCVVCTIRAKEDREQMPPPSNTGQTSSTTNHEARTPLSPRQENTDRSLDLDYAVRHGVNPRTHSARGANPYNNPFQTYQRASFSGNSENGSTDPRQARAAQYYEDYSNGYANAHITAKNRLLTPQVSKPKFRGAESQSFLEPPIPRIHIVIRKIINRHDHTRVPSFDPQVIEYLENRSFDDILDNIQKYLDGIYSSEYSHRIQKFERDFVLHYTLSKSIINIPHPVLDSEGNSKVVTVGDIWRAAIRSPNLHVTKTHAVKRLLEFTAIVEYPLTDDTSVSGSARLKRKNHLSTFETQPNKRHHRTTTYVTRVSAAAPSRTPATDEEQLNVTRVTVSMDNKGTPIWNKSKDVEEVIISKEPFSSGKMKHAFKLCFVTAPSVLYAAKTFYNLGYTEDPSENEIYVHLKEELLRQVDMKASTEAFALAAVEKSIAIHDVRMADSYLIQVVDGPKKGSTYLVDSLLNHLDMEKYSGTDTAGANTDFAGMTCDALAHFTLVDSGCEFVPVDIQGIRTQSRTRDGLRGPDCLVLFDIMTHSQMKLMGLGDQGRTGIKKFCEQHKCNTICDGLELEDVLKCFGKTADECGDDDGQGESSGEDEDN